MINGLTLRLINTKVLCWVMMVPARHTRIHQSETLLRSTVLLEVFARTERVWVLLRSKGVLLYYTDIKITKESIKCVLWVLCFANRRKD